MSVQCFLVEQSEDRHSWFRPDIGETYPNYAALPVGAMWFAVDPDIWKGMGIGPDGRSLIVKTPGGMWNIDSRASNCTLPDDNEHRCWIRHGEPPNVTVDKNGNTCQAGAGSIQCGDYHGFLQNGVLT